MRLTVKDALLAAAANARLRAHVVENSPLEAKEVKERTALALRWLADDLEYAAKRPDRREAMESVRKWKHQWEKAR